MNYRFATRSECGSLPNHGFRCSFPSRCRKKYCKLLKFLPKILKFATFFTDPTNGRRHSHPKMGSAVTAGSLCESFVCPPELQRHHFLGRHCFDQGVGSISKYRNVASGSSSFHNTFRQSKLSTRRMVNLLASV